MDGPSGAFLCTGGGVVFSPPVLFNWWYWSLAASFSRRWVGRMVLLMGFYQMGPNGLGGSCDSTGILEMMQLVAMAFPLAPFLSTLGLSLVISISLRRSVFSKDQSACSLALMAISAERVMLLTVPLL